MNESKKTTKEEEIPKNKNSEAQGDPDLIDHRVFSIVGDLKFDSGEGDLPTERFKHWMVELCALPDEEKPRIVSDLIIMSARLGKANFEGTKKAVVKLITLGSIVMQNNTKMKKMLKDAGYESSKVNKMVGKQKMEYKKAIEEAKEELNSKEQKKKGLWSVLSTTTEKKDKK